MEVTEEQWDQLNQRVSIAEAKAEDNERKLEEFKADAPKPKRPHEWAELSQDIESHLKDNFDNPGTYYIKNAFSTILRYKLGLKNVYQINSLNIDQARQILEELKRII
ncbi:hypothetical protein [Secundilactobacillus kimchicus]|uniref:hypothetical protein n=1 Tax=Secundilactobacillus kimchicus TaxID=528209 RepID=UPI0024A9D59E|nr:hypothetical protein [Secundilactobacillus kimchicus]